MGPAEPCSTTSYDVLDRHFGPAFPKPDKGKERPDAILGFRHATSFPHMEMHKANKSKKWAGRHSGGHVCVCLCDQA